MTENPQDQPTEGGQPQYSNQPPPPQPQYSSQPPPAPGRPQGYGQQAPVSPSDARMWAMFAHLGGIVLQIIAPLVIYLIYRDRDLYVRRQSAQALNFQIIIAIIEIVSIPLMFIGIGILTFFAAAISLVVFSIIAGIAANKGEEYTYPYVPQMVT